MPWTSFAGPEDFPRELNFVKVTPEGDPKHDPHNCPNHTLEASFDFFRTTSNGPGWMALRCGSETLILSPGEQRELIKLLVGRFPLDGLASI